MKTRHVLSAILAGFIVGSIANFARADSPLGARTRGFSLPADVCRGGSNCSVSTLSVASTIASQTPLYVTVESDSATQNTSAVFDTFNTPTTGTFNVNHIDIMFHGTLGTGAGNIVYKLTDGFNNCLFTSVCTSSTIRKAGTGSCAFFQSANLALSVDSSSACTTYPAGPVRAILRGFWQ